IGPGFCRAAGAADASPSPAATATSDTCRPCFESYLDLLGLGVAQDFELELVADLVSADLLDHISIGADLFVADRLDDVVGHEAGLGRGTPVGDHDKADAAVGVFAVDAQVRHTHGDVLGRRAHADFLTIDDGVDDAWILAVPVQADAAKLARGQALSQLLEV